MQRGWALALLLVAAWLAVPGDGNEGSVTGSCSCDRRLSSDKPPTVHAMERFRKLLKAYDRCPRYIRFQLPSQNLCGGSKDQWVQDLMSCFDRQECGHSHSESLAHRKDLPPPTIQSPEPTKGAPPDMGTTAQTFLPGSTLQSTLPPGTPSLDKEFPQPSETITPNQTMGHSLGDKSEAEKNQKRLEENGGLTVDTSAMVAVPSLLAIVFLLTVFLLYVVCKKRRGQSLQHPPDSQLRYIPVAPDSNA